MQPVAHMSMPWLKDRPRRISGALYDVACKTTPGLSLEFIKARPKSISLIFRCSLLTNMMLLGLRSQCTMPALVRVFIAINNCREEGQH